MTDDGLGMRWTVGRRTFRSWVPDEAEQYAFLVMWAPLTDPERRALEMFDGLDELHGRLPMTVPAIAAWVRADEGEVRDLLTAARRKLERYLRFNGLVLRKDPPDRSAAEGLERLRAAARAHFPRAEPPTTPAKDGTS